MLHSSYFCCTNVDDGSKVNRTAEIVRNVGDL